MKRRIPWKQTVEVRVERGRLLLCSYPWLTTRKMLPGHIPSLLDTLSCLEVVHWCRSFLEKLDRLASRTVCQHKGEIPHVECSSWDTYL